MKQKNQKTYDYIWIEKDEDKKGNMPQYSNSGI